LLLFLLFLELCLFKGSQFLRHLLDLLIFLVKLFLHLLFIILLIFGKLALEFLRCLRSDLTFEILEPLLNHGEFMSYSLQIMYADVFNS
jgi:hypothetical protein